MRGPLILLEGLDRAGKSSQCELLVKRLTESGTKAHLFRYPDRTTETGKMIDAYLKSHSGGSDQMIHLMFSANRWESANALMDILNRGEAVVLDRYFYSGIAFSAAKDVAGMDISWCKHPDVGLPLPDLTLFLDVSEDIQQQRGGYGAERYEKVEFQKKVRSVFYRLREGADDWVTVSADGTFDEVAEKIWAEVTNTLGAGIPTEIKRFC